MSDIVERLRVGGYDFVDFDEAADEIERLRAAAAAIPAEPVAQWHPSHALDPLRSARSPQAGGIEVSDVSVPNSAITVGPSVQWDHIDGPLMHWAGSMHWLTWRERLSVWIGRHTVDDIACKHWPRLAELRAQLQRTTP